MGEYFTFMNVLPQGARTFGNTSLTDQVAFTDDQVAILVPASIPPSVTFDTSSIGVQSSCRRCGSFIILRLTEPDTLVVSPPSAYIPGTM